MNPKQNEIKALLVLFLMQTKKSFLLQLKRNEIYNEELENITMTFYENLSNFSTKEKMNQMHTSFCSFTLWKEKKSQN